jgi:dimethylsulfoniopropionate demethylase
MQTTTMMPMTVRMRRSPFFERSLQAGATGHLIYNNMYIATGFDTPESDYLHLKRAVQLWDVGCERQIEISGPDAAKLVQMSTPRDISTMQPDQCFYIPTVDGDGYMTNDPVLLQVAPNRYWVSIADSDLILFYKGLAAGLSLDATVREPDVSPLGIQGPMADALVERVWGAGAARIGFFRHTRVDVDGVPMILARSGYSLQGGYELYYEGSDEGRDAGNDAGNRLWDKLMEAGADLDVRAGAPVQAERVEGGLLSYLSDITSDMTPFEAGLGHFCDVQKDTACLALTALRKNSEPQRQIRPVSIDGDPLPPMTGFWPVTDVQGNPVGRISSAAYAFSFKENIGIGLIDRLHWQAGTELSVHAADGIRKATIRSGFPGRQARAKNK